MSNQIKRLFCLLACVCIPNSAFAGPWLLPGNLAVKSDIDLLADAGLIKAPVMTWPIAWANIGPDLLSPEAKEKLPTEPKSVQQAYQRILKLYQQSYQPYKVQTAAYASGSNRLNPFRTFQYQPYADFASGVSADYQMQHVASSLNVSYYHAPNQSYTDDVHLDNSYFYLLSENWAFGIDQFNRWWGPGYSDAMILSQNAEPFPAISVQRIQARAFKTKWLHWIGPWSVNSVVSENGSYDTPGIIDKEMFWFTNVSFRPFQSLQFDISRNVLFAGEQRPMSWKKFYYMITFRNSWAKSTEDQAPGSEEWDIGTKLSLMPIFKIPLEFYQQTLFSDEGGNTWFHLPLPDCTTFLLGADNVMQFSIGTLKTYFEYEYNLERLYYFWGAQTGSIGSAVVGDTYGGQYPYYYFSRLLSSALGSEGIGYTLGMVLNENKGNSDTASVRFLQLNNLNWGATGEIGYPFSKQDVVWASIGRSIQLTHNLGNLTGEIGYLFFVKGEVNHLASGTSATLTWSKKF